MAGPRLRVGVVGCGTGGPAAALFLPRLGHEVTVLERVPNPQPIGAGILLQPTGQAVLRALGVYDQVASRGSVIRRVYAVSHRGRAVMDFGYDDGRARAGDGDLFALGIHRGVLFDALFDALPAAGVELRLGVEPVNQTDANGSRWLIDRAGERHGPFDLVVAADGARSQLRDDTRLVRRDQQYPWGALWAIVDDTRRRHSETLYQHYHGTRVTLGLLPTGTPDGTAKVSLFWSVDNRQVADIRQRGLAAFKDRIHRLTPEADDVLDQLVDDTQLVHAVYRDVVLRRFDDERIALVGDAAHAMSPQLGQGANLALLDAAALADASSATPTSRLR